MIRYFKRLIFLLVVNMHLVLSYSQVAWPATDWSSAVNLSADFPLDATELSGLYWNNLTNCLYAIGDGGSVYVLHYDKTTGQYTLLDSALTIHSPEGITQVDNSAREFYTIDEQSYEIRKYTYGTNFLSLSKSKSWYLLQSPSPMTDTGNTGPEGIAFVPDSYLQRIGFLSSVTGHVYTSVKGMCGLIFIAHQDGGYVWVFDVNPNVSNDFAYVGKYRTNRSESCETTFDCSTGLLYVLHNVNDNYLEVTDLSTTIVSGEYKFKTLKEYYIPNPSGSINVEGFALSPKYPANLSMGVWLCRDVSKKTETLDAIRWFNQFTFEGNEITGLTNIAGDAEMFSVYPDLVNDNLTLKSSTAGSFSVKIYSVTGQLVLEKDRLNAIETINLKNLGRGIYFVKLMSGNKQGITKTIIKIE